MMALTPSPVPDPSLAHEVGGDASDDEVVEDAPVKRRRMDLEGTATAPVLEEPRPGDPCDELLSHRQMRASVERMYGQSLSPARLLDLQEVAIHLLSRTEEEIKYCARSSILDSLYSQMVAPMSCAPGPFKVSPAIVTLAGYARITEQNKCIDPICLDSACECRVHPLWCVFGWILGEEDVKQLVYILSEVKRVAHILIVADSMPDHTMVNERIVKAFISHTDKSSLKTITFMLACITESVSVDCTFASGWNVVLHYLPLRREKCSRPM